MPRLALLILLLAARTAFAQSGPPANNPNKDVAIQIAWDQKVPMRDGVRLSATVYRNPAQARRVPAIVMLTPYIAEHGARQGTYFAQNGYVFVAADARGRGNSDGKFLPGQVEARDGYDLIEWAARQPWCDGQVATWGGSWLGFTQWSIAKERPPHLKAMAPIAPVYPGVDYPQGHGFFTHYVLRWLSYVHGRALNKGLFENSEFWTNNEVALRRSGRPFQDFDAITGVAGTVFRTWLAHPREDAFWTALTPRAEDFAKLAIPVLTITGHYDGDQLGSLTYYDRHMAHGAKDVIARHQLVIGPWDHGGTRRPVAELGGVSFGPSAVMNMEDLHKAWYDHVLKGGPPPAFLKDRVACFVMGRNAWIYASSLAQLESEPLKLELDLARAAPGDAQHGGDLRAPSGPGSVVLVSDPKAALAAEDDDPSYLLAQRDALRDSPAQVVLHSAPLAEDTIVTGRARLHLQVAVDQPDADLFAALYEVTPSGQSFYLGDTQMRLRYRKGGVAGVPMTPNKPERVDLPPFTFFARALGKGSRLRLVIATGAQRGYQPNTNTGGNLASEPLSAARVARVTLASGPGLGSLLELPRPEPAVLKRNAAALEPAAK